MSTIEKLKALDWVDILIHVGVAAGAVGAAFLTAYVHIGSILEAGFLSGMIAEVGAAVVSFLAALVNTAAWPLRERLQRGGTPFSEWSLQKHMEAWMPVKAGWLVFSATLWLVFS